MTKKVITKGDLESIRGLTIDKPKPSSPLNQGMTRRDKAFADALLNDPKKTQRDAFKESRVVREGTSDASIDVQASRLLRKPQIVSYLANYSDMVENTLLNTVQDWGREENTRKREIANNTAMYIHDKIHGKATQVIQQRSEIVKIAINLSGDGEQPPDDMLDLTDVTA